MQHLVQEMARGRPLRQVCREDEGMPDHSTILLWVGEDEEIAEAYRRGQTALAEYWVGEILEIADDGRRDRKIIQKNGKHIEVVDHDHIRRSELMVNTRKWLLAKVLPHRFGDRFDVTSGGKPLPPVRLRLFGEVIEF